MKNSSEREMLMPRHSALFLAKRAQATEQVTLIKVDGEEIPNITALVQPDKITLEDGSLRVEEGDTIRRTLRNGFVEEYVVLDRGYYSGSHLTYAHYQAKVRKKTAITHPAPISNNYHVTGENSRINIGSTDNSSNIVNSAGDAELFAGLRKAIENHVEDEKQRALILARIADMEATQKTPDFTAKYQAFIQQAANHMTIVTPFIPALTQLLPILAKHH
jgi:hypothetical protein